jgi:hypothetical protein
MRSVFLNAVSLNSLVFTIKVRWPSVAFFAGNLNEKKRVSLLSFISNTSIEASVQSNTLRLVHSRLPKPFPLRLVKPLPESQCRRIRPTVRPAIRTLCLNSLRILCTFLKRHFRNKGKNMYVSVIEIRNPSFSEDSVFSVRCVFSGQYDDAREDLYEVVQVVDPDVSGASFQ